MAGQFVPKNQQKQEPFQGFTIKQDKPQTEKPWWQSLGGGWKLPDNIGGAKPGGSPLTTARDIAGIAERPIADALSVGASAGHLGSAGLFSMTGQKDKAEAEKQKASKDISEGVDVPGFGRSKPVSINQPKRMIGRAAEIAGTMTGGEGLLPGVVSGAAISGGAAAERDAGAGEIAADTAGGAAAGGLFSEAQLIGNKAKEEGMSALTSTIKGQAGQVRDWLVTLAKGFTKGERKEIETLAPEVLQRFQQFSEGGLSPMQMAETKGKMSQEIVSNANNTAEKAYQKVQDQFGQREEIIATRVGDKTADKTAFQNSLQETLRNKQIGYENRATMKGAVKQKGGWSMTGATDDVKAFVQRIQHTIDNHHDFSFRGLMQLKGILGDMYTEHPEGVSKSILDNMYGTLMGEAKNLGGSKVTSKQIDIMLGDYKAFLDKKVAVKNLFGDMTNAASSDKAINEVWSSLKASKPARADALKYFEKVAGQEPGTLDRSMRSITYAETFAGEHKPMPFERQFNVKRMMGKTIETLAGGEKAITSTISAMVEKAKSAGIKVTPAEKTAMAKTLTSPFFRNIVLQELLGNHPLGDGSPAASSDGEQGISMDELLQGVGSAGSTSDGSMTMQDLTSGMDAPASDTSGGGLSPEQEVDVQSQIDERMNQ